MKNSDGVYIYTVSVRSLYELGVSTNLRQCNVFACGKEKLMIIGKVVGSIVSTRKNDNLVGHKLMIIKPMKSMSESSGEFVAIDNVGAGIGEIVLVARGSAARIGCGCENAPVDAAIVGIVDDANGLECD